MTLNDAFRRHGVLAWRGHLPTSPVIPAKSWHHAISTAAAAILALYVAFLLELPSPASAAVTVIIVSSPLPGMVLSKGIWRFAGTLIGIVFSIVLIALFAQSPDAFLLALALWLGLCTFTSSLLRYFRAYGAVLAGYTTSLVALPAIDAPDQIFDLATSRIGVVTVGILCAALVKGLLSLRTGPARLGPALETALAETARYAAKALDLDADHPIRRRAIAEQLIALDPLIHAAAHESALTAQQAPSVRFYVSILLNLVTLTSSVRDDLVQFDPGGPVTRAIEPLRIMMRDLLASLSSQRVFLSRETEDAINVARRHAAERINEIASVLRPSTLDALALANRIKDVLEQLSLARAQLGAIEQRRRGRAVTSVSYHRDLHEAAINGVRAASAALICGAFWFTTRWSSGSQMLAIVLPLASLLGTSDRPDLASIAFAKGTVVSTIFAGLCQFLILNQIQGFPLLASAIAPVLVVASLISLNPKYSGEATAFMIFFVTFSGIRNPMQYDLAAFLNTAVATLLGAGATVIGFRVLWPIKPSRAVARLIRLSRDDLMRLAERPLDTNMTIWESTMHDRLARLSTRLTNSPKRAAIVEDGMSAIHIGRALVFAVEILGSIELAPSEAVAVATALKAMRYFTGAPEAAIDTCADGARELLIGATVAEMEPVGARTRRLRAAAAFHEMAQLMRRHPGFFSTSGQAARPAVDTAA